MRKARQDSATRAGYAKRPSFEVIATQLCVMNQCVPSVAEARELKRRSPFHLQSNRKKQWAARRTKQGEINMGFPHCSIMFNPLLRPTFFSRQRSPFSSIFESVVQLLSDLGAHLETLPQLTFLLPPRLHKTGSPCNRGSPTCNCWLTL